MCRRPWLTIHSLSRDRKWQTHHAQAAAAQNRRPGPRTVAGNPVRRIIEIDVAAAESRRLLRWLDAVSVEHIILGVQPLELSSLSAAA